MSAKLNKGRRILFRDGGQRLQDGEVQEFSQSGTYVRISYQWHAASAVTVVEELPEASQTPEPPDLAALYERMATALEGIAKQLETANGTLADDLGAGADNVAKLVKQADVLGYALAQILTALNPLAAQMAAVKASNPATSGEATANPSQG